MHANSLQENDTPVREEKANATLFQYKMSLKERSCWVVNIRMDDAERLSLEAIGRFVEASEEIRFEAEDRSQLYSWVERVMVGQE